MSSLRLTAEQLAVLAEVLKQLTEITRQTGIEFDGLGMWQIEYAGNHIRVCSGDDGYYVDNYCS